MSNHPPNKHKRQRSSAQNISFHFEAPTQDPPQFPPQYPNRRHGQLPAPISSSSQELQNIPGPFQYPPTEQRFPQPYDYALDPQNQQYRDQYPREQDLRQPEQYPRIPESSANFGHRKDVSISTHFDMFNLNQFDPRTQQSKSQHPLFHSTPQVKLEHDPSRSVLDDLLAQMLRVDASNLNPFLLEVLRKLDPGLPLDDFYNLLYNSENFSFYVVQTEPYSKIDKTLPASSLNPSVDILHSLLDIFRTPESLYAHFPTVEMSDIKLASVNFHELLRSFLAIKILFDALVEDPPGTLEQATLPRLSIYKLYYILCQKLILKYPTSSNSTSLQQKLILGQSKLGKLVKIVYPKLVSKRLGRRGESKYNYLGVSWNDNIVDEDIAAMCDHEISQLYDIFKVQKKQMELLQGKVSSLRVQQRKHRRQSSASAAVSDHSWYSRIDRQIPKAKLSFIQYHLRFPAISLSPISLVDQSTDSGPNWFGTSSQHSLIALLVFSTNISLIREVLFSTESLEKSEDAILRGLCDDLLAPILRSEYKEDKEYLHLFFICAIELLPYLMLIRSPKSANFIHLLKANVQHVVKNLEKEVVLLEDSSIDLQDVIAFIGLLRRMINFNGLLTSFLRIDLASDVVSGMQKDVKKIVQEGLQTATEGEMSELHRLISKCVIQTLIGYQYTPKEDGQQMSVERIIEMINEDCKTLQELLQVDVMRFLVEMEQYHAQGSLKMGAITEDTVRAVKKWVSLIDQKFLVHTLKEHYPISIFTSFTTLVTNQVLQFIYREHTIPFEGSERGSLPNNATFRHWWMVASFLQEYLVVLGELVGLQDSLT